MSFYYFENDKIVTFVPELNLEISVVICRFYMFVITIISYNNLTLYENLTVLLPTNFCLQ